MAAPYLTTMITAGGPPIASVSENPSLTLSMQYDYKERRLSRDREQDRERRLSVS